MKVYLIGSSSLLVQCATVLVRKKWNIKGIISTDDCVKKWAALHRIPILTLQELSSQPVRSFDFLFSVVNPFLIKEKLLNLPRFYTINYHDSPLPRYAGIHATNWAVLNRESSHAISWHIVDVGIDTGDILVQLPVCIKPNDTVYTLNLRCLDRAIFGFELLVEQCEQNKFHRIKQNTLRRTYYSGRLKPPYNGVVFWSWPASKICRIIRSTYYADYPNDYSIVKFFVKNEWFLIKSSKVSSNYSSYIPGRIFYSGADTINIATGSYPIIIEEVISLFHVFS